MPTKSESFEQRCYKVLKSVPRGKVTTYSAIARALKSKAYRAVGTAMRKNLDPNVPCHRVVLSDGKVGSYNRGGSPAKTKMLELEGVSIKGGKIDLATYAARLGSK